MLLIPVFGSSRSNIYWERSHSSLEIGERETKGETARGSGNQDRRVVCSTPPPPPPIHLNKAASAPLPLTSPPPPFGVYRDFSSGSLWWPPFSRSGVQNLILDSDGDHFLFSPIFCRTPVSRYVYCYSLAKKQWNLGGHRYFVDAKICDVFFMAGRYNKLVRYGRESAHKSRAARGNATLGDCMRGN